MGFLGAAIGLYLYNKPVEGVSSSDAHFNITAQQLLTDFETDETAANKKYIGKIIAVKGKISEIGAG